MFHVARGVAVGSAVAAAHETHMATHLSTEGHVAAGVHVLASDGQELLDRETQVFRPTGV